MKNIFKKLFGNDQKENLKDKVQMKELYSISSPRPDYEEGTCISDLKYMNVKYEDIPFQHLTVLFKWVNSEKKPGMIGYNEKQFLDGIEKLRAGSFVINDENGLYKLYEKN
jgi:hypothetical protein